MLEIEKKACVYNLPLVGHCTDSAANSLKALLKQSTPFEALVEKGVCFLGLPPASGFMLFVPFFWHEYPCIAYACWDHSGRTAIRKLLNNKLELVAETVGSKYLPHNIVASVQDLHHLKNKHPNSIVKPGHISLYIHQNCDATSRVLTDE